jgi:hypothetical protein
MQQLWQSLALAKHGSPLWARQLSGSLPEVRRLDECRRSLSAQQARMQVPLSELQSHLPLATPNPSIEGMPKRLRLLVTPHVKR